MFKSVLQGDIPHISELDSELKTKKIEMVAHSFNLITEDIEAGRSLSSN